MKKSLSFFVPPKNLIPVELEDWQALEAELKSRVPQYHKIHLDIIHCHDLSAEEIGGRVIIVRFFLRVGKRQVCFDLLKMPPKIWDPSGLWIETTDRPESSLQLLPPKKYDKVRPRLIEF